MSSIVLIVVVFVVLIVLAVFFWFWWVGPRDQVPPHLDDDELRRLEVQDRIRQTNYQILTALGLGATFLATLFQFAITTQHWTTEYAAKLNQERLGQFVEAVKQIDRDASTVAQSSSAQNTSALANYTPIANIAGIRTLLLLGLKDPTQYHVQANDVLSTLLRGRAKSEVIVGGSGECSNEFGNPPVRPPAPSTDQEVTVHNSWYSTGRYDREEALPEVQAAMSALGDPEFASFRWHGSSNTCQSPLQKGAYLKLEHLFLDNLDLSGLDLSCSQLTQTRFRRTNLNNANLFRANLGGSQLGDYAIRDTPSNPLIGNSDTIKDLLYKPETAGGPPAWKRTRCWVTELRGANLSYADLSGATLAGADLRGANVTGANFCRVDISRANFEGAVGLTKAMLEDACAGSPAKPDDEGKDIEIAFKAKFAQPVGLPFPVTIPRCTNTCPSEIRADKEKPSASESFWFKKNPQQIDIFMNVLAILLLAVAAVTFYGVGYYARSILEVRDARYYFASRFPEKGVTYDASKIASFVKYHPDRANKYRYPILFPLDLIVMFLLSASLGGATWYWLDTAGFAYCWIALLLPVLYFTFDLAEDIVLRSYLQGDAVFDDVGVQRLKIVTRMKMIFVAGAITQTVFAIGLYTVRLST